jgi:hypothetical protein
MRDVTKDDAGHGLSPRALAGVRALAEALFATDAGAPTGDRLDWLCAELDDFFARTGAKSRIVFAMSLFVVGILAPILIGRFRPLRALPLSERTHALDKMEQGKLSLPLLAIKAMLCVLYYEHPDAAREIGFDGQCMVQNT